MGAEVAVLVGTAAAMFGLSPRPSLEAAMAVPVTRAAAPAAATVSSRRLNLRSKTRSSAIDMLVLTIWQTANPRSLPRPTAAEVWKHQSRHELATRAPVFA